jgi:prohibitin 2
MYSILLISFLVSVSGFFVTIPEGHVGLYWTLGKLQDDLIKNPTFYLPIYSDITLIKYVQDWDNVIEDNSEKISCVSKEGVTLKMSVTIANKIQQDSIIRVVREYGKNYDKVLVVNPVAQKLKEICAMYTVDEIEITFFSQLDDLLKDDIQKQIKDFGITVEWVRISGIIVPETINVKRLEIAAEKSDKLLVDEKAIKQKSQKETEFFLESRDQEKITLMLESEMKRSIIKAESQQKEEEINNKILILKAEANSKKQELEMQNIKNLHSIPGYIELKISENIHNNEKIYYGDKLPIVMYGVPSPFDKKIVLETK